MRITTAKAIEQVRSGECFDAVALAESGLLYWINRNSFHTFGFKLVANSDGTFNFVGNGRDPITHDQVVAAQRNAALVQVLASHDGPQIEWWRKNLD